MADGLTWTRPRSLTFCERMKLTWTLCLLRLPMPSVWLTILWSIGARVSFHLTDPKTVSLRIVSANGSKELEVTVKGEAVTAM